MDYPRKKSFAAELLKKRQKKSPAIIAIAVVAVIIAIAAVGYALYMRFGEKEISTEEVKSIAVLPFVNMSLDPNQVPFCDGIAEEILNKLAQIDGLRVIARTSAFSFKGKDVSISTIGEKLNVDTVLEGSVRKEGNQIRLTAQLIKVADESHLWSGQYDRELKSLFSIQSEIAQAIIEELKGTLLDSEKEAVVKRHTDNLEAFNLYSMGLYHWNKRTKEGLEKALDYFQQAIDKDPNYALAYSGMADSYSMMAAYGYMTGIDAYPQAKEKAEKALEIDNKLAEAHTSLAYNFQFGGIYININTAEREYRRALELNPGYATAHKWYALLLANKGQLTEGLEEMKIALNLDPLSLIINADIIPYYGDLGRYDEAREQFNKAIELDPNFSNTYVKFANVCIQQGKYKDAEKLLLKALEMNPHGHVYSGLGNLYTRQGKYKDAEKLLLEGIEMYPSDLVYNSLGNLYNRQGKYKETEKLMLEAFEMNLNQSWIYRRLEEAYLRQRKYKELEELMLEATEMYPSDTWFYIRLGAAYIQQGKYDEGIDACKKAVKMSGYPSANLWAEGWLGQAYVLTGKIDNAERIIISLKERKEFVYDSLIWIANINMALEENDTAFEWLQKAFEEDYANLDVMEYLPEYDNFRSDPKCMALMKKMGLDE